MEKRPDPQPEERASVESGAVGKDASEKRDSLAMAAGVAILAFDRVAPVTRHLQKPRLESVIPSLDLREAMLRLHLRVESVRLVQTLKHFAVALLCPEKLGELLGYIRFEKEVSGLAGVEICLVQIFRGFHELRALARDHTDVSKDFATPRRHFFGPHREELPALRQCFVIALAGDVELDPVHREIEQPGPVSVLFKSTGRFRVRRLCIAKLAKLHVGEADVVENLRLMIAHSQRLVPEMAKPERFEGAAQIAAYYRDRSKVLIEHCDQSSIAGALCLVAGGLIDLRSLIEIATGLVDDPHHVQSLRDGRRRAKDVGRGDRCFENIKGGAPIALLHVCAPEPAQHREPCARVHVRVPYQLLVDRARVGPASFALGKLGAIYALVDCGGFHRLYFYCGPAKGHGT